MDRSRGSARALGGHLVSGGRADGVRRGGASGDLRERRCRLPDARETATVSLGPPDVIFFSLFLAAADRFRLRVTATWVAMCACLGATLVLVWSWDSVAGLPALPAICLGFLVPNADLLWHDVRRARAGASEAG